MYAIRSYYALSELTSAVAMSRCDDKAVTRRLMRHEGLRVPEQLIVDAGEDEPRLADFIERHSQVVSYNFV